MQKFFKKKNIASLIAITLMLTIAFSMAFTTPVNAAYARFYKDMVYVSVAPVTIGTGQNVIIAFWCDKLPPTALGEYGDRFYFDVNIIKPDGTNETLTNIESDPVGAGYANYVPIDTGTYTIQAIMRQHVIDGGASRGKIAPNGAGWWPSGQPPAASAIPAGWKPIGVVFESALSEPQTLTVTTEQLSRYVETPLPMDYWSRPVYDAVRGWGPIVMGQYLGASELTAFGNSRYNPYTVGPGSSHVLWTRPFFNGGIAGGYSTVNSSSADNSYYSGQSYESYGGPSIILNGKFYYSVGTNPREGWYCCDLYTGETIYFRNNTVSAASGGSTSAQGSIPSGAPAFGQVLVEDNPNQHGTISYYWVTSPIGKTNTWEMYDDFSGNYMCSIANVTWTDTNNGRSVSKGASGTSAVGPDGSILRYNFVNLAPANAAPQWYLQVWNTSQAIMYPAYVQHETGSGTNANWMWRPNLNMTYDGRNGLSTNASVPSLALSTINVRQVIPDDQLVIIYPGSNNGSVSVPGSVVSVNLKPGSVGQVLYSYNFTCPQTVGDLYGQAEQFSNKNTAYSGVCIQEGIFWYYDAMTRLYFVYNLNDGSKAWTAPPSEQFQFYGGANAVCFKGQFIDCGGYSGVVRSFDAKTGTSLWNWSAPMVGLDETPYQHSPTSFGFLTGDGQMYFYSSEHSNNNPIRRDAQIWDVNATNGNLIWMLTNWPSSAPIIADGLLLVVDSHDQMIYCFGKGPSATTVSAPQIVPPLGSTIQLTGTVTDQSQYGRRNINGDLDRPLKGTPAISDASMDAWMEYMFHQRPMPTNAKGVSVSLDTIDPNGNLIHIGDATSDAAGNYGLAYKPEVPGSYQIIASFKGSNSYGSSFGTTYLTIGAEPTTPAPTAIVQTQSVADTYLIPVGIAIIVAIAIATIVIVLALRKRP
jgi:outer membrane protein assembly factor BamB